MLINIYKHFKLSLAFKTNLILHLVFHGNFCGESVVCVPFLAEVETQIFHFVLGLQVATGLPCVCVAGARRGKLLQDKEGWSDEGRMEMKKEVKREAENSSLLN